MLLQNRQLTQRDKLSFRPSYINRDKALVTSIIHMNNDENKRPLKISNIPISIKNRKRLVFVGLLRVQT